MIEKLVFKLSIFCLLFLVDFQGYSQVGILTDTPDISSVLDISSTDKGLLIPRLTNAEKWAIANPAHSLLVFDTDENSVSQNIGTEQAPVWNNLTLFNKQSFYMPSIDIATETLRATKTIDLFMEYKNQFKDPMFKSVGAPASIPHYTSAYDLFYYITYYDPELIAINSISNQGVLSYTILKKANYDSYVNIIFVVR
ncbi:hypothetical protein OIU80_20285 [Flavobacterium sp. LS1R47]|uniref:Uncharacterized protein n=1 Tax=Flavobacterium frigoritolerans TaxID=2987686 RepID=A0A9X3HPB9_9FLAO|nr:hypothetical protein [Flavobacterium frigoritolerans]MCV9934628.1 hypothetical protein [Flavobacterium frigoritolerans]